MELEQAAQILGLSVGNYNKDNISEKFRALVIVLHPDRKGSNITRERDKHITDVPIQQLIEARNTFSRYFENNSIYKHQPVYASLPVAKPLNEDKTFNFNFTLNKEPKPTTRTQVYKEKTCQFSIDALLENKEKLNYPAVEKFSLTELWYLIIYCNDFYREEPIFDQKSNREDFLNFSRGDNSVLFKTVAPAIMAESDRIQQLPTVDQFYLLYSSIIHKKIENTHDFYQIYSFLKTDENKNKFLKESNIAEKIKNWQDLQVIYQDLQSDHQEEIFQALVNKPFFIKIKAKDIPSFLSKDHQKQLLTIMLTKGGFKDKLLEKEYYLIWETNGNKNLFTPDILDGLVTDAVEKFGEDFFPTINKNDLTFGNAYQQKKILEFANTCNQMSDEKFVDFFNTHLNVMQRQFDGEILLYMPVAFSGNKKYLYQTWLDKNISSFELYKKGQWKPNQPYNINSKGYNDVRIYCLLSDEERSREFNFEGYFYNVLYSRKDRYDRERKDFYLEKTKEYLVLIDLISYAECKKYVANNNLLSSFSMQEILELIEHLQSDPDKLQLLEQKIIDRIAKFGKSDSELKNSNPYLEWLETFMKLDNKNFCKFIGNTTVGYVLIDLSSVQDVNFNKKIQNILNNKSFSYENKEALYNLLKKLNPKTVETVIEADLNAPITFKNIKFPLPTANQLVNNLLELENDQQNWKSYLKNLSIVQLWQATFALLEKTKMQDAAQRESIFTQFIDALPERYQGIQKKIIPDDIFHSLLKIDNCVEFLQENKLYFLLTTHSYITVEDTSINIHSLLRTPKPSYEENKKPIAALPDSAPIDNKDNDKAPNIFNNLRNFFK